MQAAAGNLKKVSLELGGKSPNIVFADADLEAAIPGAANGIFFNHGQCCNAGSRLFIQKEVFDDVVAGVAEIGQSIKLAPGTDPDAQMGPLVSDEQFEKVLGYLDSGRSDGAEAVIGGGRHGDRGYFVQPTILTNTNPDMKVVREEIFGPVVCAIPFNSPEEIVPVANDTHLRPGRGRVHARHLQGAPHGQAAARRHGVDQHLPRVRRGDAVRRLQGVRLGPRDGPAGAGELPGDQVGGDSPLDRSSSPWPR